LPGPPARAKSLTIQYDVGRLASRDRKIGRRRRLGVAMGVAVRAAGAAGLGASAQCLVDDGLDGSRAAAALGAAAEAAVELLGVAGKALVLRGLDDTADVVVAQHVAGTDDH